MKPATHLQPRALIISIAAIAAASCYSSDPLDSRELFDTPYCAIETDDRRDGSINSVAHATFEEDLLVRRDIDGLNDGSIDNVELFRRDSRGNLTRFERDYLGDGVLDYVEERTFDRFDNEITYREDDGDDGVFERIELHQFDGSGSPTLSEYDLDGDELVDVTATYTTDSDGNITTAEYSDFGGSIYAWNERTYWRGQLLTSETFDAFGGELTSSADYGYDDSGRLINYHYDSDADGVDDALYTWQWDDSDRLIQTDALDGPERKRFFRTYDCPL